MRGPSVDHDGTSDARSIAAAVLGICRKYRIEWLLALTKDGNRKTAIHVRPEKPESHRRAG